jgi:uncharacterized membrane protein YkoI
MRCVLGAIVLGMALGCASFAACAEQDYEHARQLRLQGRILPLELILKRVEALYPGRVLEVEIEERGGNYVYEIEMLDAGGSVRTMKLDAASGALLQDREAPAERRRERD